jgi:NAD+ synthase (glutamine-hydrolysing)
MPDFHNIYSHGYVRGAVCVPRVRIADPAYNLTRTLGLARRAHELHAGLAVFPELGLSAYSNEDLFHQDALLDGVLAAVGGLVEQSREICPILLVGAPLRFEGKLFNCALVVHRGQLLGIVPKRYIPNYREFYEKRQFTSGRDAVAREVSILGTRVPFGTDLVFDADDLPGFSLHVEICEDLWAPVPPSTYAALAGATVIGNLSASNVIIGKADYRKDLCAAQSGKCITAYLYAAAGQGESTTDLAWDGHALIYENNELLAEGPRFSDEEQVIHADLDLERLAQERMRMSTFNDGVGDHLARVQAMRRIPFRFDAPAGDIPLHRPLDRFPYVPSEPRKRDERCYEAYNIQVHGLMQRLRATRMERVVIGVSGGLDSTQALIVCAKAMDRLGLPRSNILAYTMPGFGTTDVTKENAWTLMEAMGVTAEEIDIRPSSKQMLEDIGHPASRGEAVYDITYENVQAGERTSHLFRLANHHRAIVIGTGDLSELALGWTTYGVGDHMSHYNVNASVPKTLIQYLIRWVISTAQFDDETGAVLTRILHTEISPELIPPDPDGNGQRTQDVVGPYDLQDFHLYFVSRYGFRPSKVAFIAHAAWGSRENGGWPEGMPESARAEYDLPTIKKWLEVFLHRFIELSQFKRSAMPNAPKVGSGGSLSPRGDWRAPSDASARPWIEELRANVP